MEIAAARETMTPVLAAAAESIMNIIAAVIAAARSRRQVWHIL